MFRDKKTAYQILNDPLPFGHMVRSFDKVLDSFFSGSELPPHWVHKCKSIDKYTKSISIEMPGYSKEDVKIEYFGNEITVHKIEEDDFYYANSFEESIDKIEASMKNGLLDITVYLLKPEEPKKNTVEIS